MKRLTISILTLIFLLAFTLIPLSQSNVVYADGTTFEGFRDNISDLFIPESISKIDEQVYLGGYPLGLTIDGNGVTVVGLNEFVGANGKLCCPALDVGIAVGDIVSENKMSFLR